MRASGLAGTQLTGRPVLEVPPQPSGVPRAVLDHANDLDIIIRDVNGHVYNPEVIIGVG